MRNFKKIGLLVVGATAAAMADAPTVDLSGAQTTIESAGTALLGIAVVMLGAGLVWKFLSKKS
jgi:hypothetical protein